MERAYHSVNYFIISKMISLQTTSFNLFEYFIQAFHSLHSFLIDRYRNPDNINEMLSEYDAHLTDSSLFVYPTVIGSDYHTFEDSPWNKPFIEMISLYLS